MFFLREDQPIRIELCFSITVYWKSTNQNPAFSKTELFIFFKNLNQFLKKVYQKTFEPSRVTLQEKEKIPNYFLIDEIDVNSYFFHTFFDVFIVKNRVFRLSKVLFKETYSIKDITLDPHITYQKCKLTAGLHLTRKKIFFFLENLKLSKSHAIKNKKNSFYPLSNTQTC